MAGYEKDERGSVISNDMNPLERRKAFEELADEFAKGTSKISTSYDRLAGYYTFRGDGHFNGILRNKHVKAIDPAVYNRAIKHIAILRKGLLEHSEELNKKELTLYRNTTIGALIGLLFPANYLRSLRKKYLEANKRRKEECEKIVAKYEALEEPVKKIKDIANNFFYNSFKDKNYAEKAIKSLSEIKSELKTDITSLKELLSSAGKSDPALDTVLIETDKIISKINNKEDVGYKDTKNLDTYELFGSENKTISDIRNKKYNYADFMEDFDDKKFPLVNIGRFPQDKSIIVPVDAAKEEIKSDICEALNKKPTIQDDAFLSTTSEEPMGETSFGPNKLTIICKPGKVKAADITDLSLFSTSENERLFVPGAKFKVKSYTVENDSHLDFPYKFNITVETV